MFQKFFQNSIFLIILVISHLNKDNIVEISSKIVQKLLMKQPDIMNKLIIVQTISLLKQMNIVDRCKALFPLLQILCKLL